MSTEIQLAGETDAHVWAKEWIRMRIECPEIADDEHTMFTWFANAIMAGYDQGIERALQSVEEVIPRSFKRFLTEIDAERGRSKNVTGRKLRQVWRLHRRLWYAILGRTNPVVPVVPTQPTSYETTPQTRPDAPI